MHEHRKQWENNESLIQWLQSNKCSYYDWLIIIAFYAALHKMDILIHQKFPGYDKKKESLKETGHIYRNKMINKYYKEISSDYLTLYRQSRKLRYEQRSLNKIKEKTLNYYLDLWFKKIKPLEPFSSS